MQYIVNLTLRIHRKADNCYRVTLIPVSDIEECLCETILSDEMLADIERLEEGLLDEEDFSPQRPRKYPPIDGQFLQQLGEKLFNCLFTGTLNEAFHEAFGVVRENNNAGLRIRLVCDPPEIAVLPWELMFKKKRFLSTWDKVSVTRYLNLSQKFKQLEIKPPINVLIVIPSGSHLGVEKEKQVVHKALKAFEDRGLMKLDFVDDCVSKDVLFDKLNQGKEYHILHFIGHGCFGENSDQEQSAADQDREGYLRLNLDPNAEPLENDKRSKLEKDGWLRADAFADLFTNHPSMKLVVLNACEGGKLSTTRPLAGIAPRLLSRDIPAVVAMQFPVFDDSALTFASLFYRSLCSRRDFGLLDIAIITARLKLHIDRGDDLDFATPVLFMNSESGVIFDWDEETTETAESPGSESGFKLGIYETATTGASSGIGLFSRLKQSLYERAAQIGDRPRLQAVSAARKANLELAREEEQRANPGESAERAQIRAAEEVKLARVQSKLAEVAKVSLRASRLLIAFSFVFLVATVFGVFNVIGIDDFLQNRAASLREGPTGRWGNDQIRLIAIEPEPIIDGFPNADGKQDRRQHAALIHALTDAKAKVIVLDLWYEDASSWDKNLAEAIGRAARAGTEVIIGVEGVNAQGSPIKPFPPDLEPELRDRWGNINIGLSYQLSPLKLAKGLDGLRTVVRYVELGKIKAAQPDAVPEGAVPISSSLLLEALRRFRTENSQDLPNVFFYKSENLIKLLDRNGSIHAQIPVMDEEMSFMFSATEENEMEPFRHKFQDVYQRLTDPVLLKQFEGKLVIVGYREAGDLHNIAGGREMYGMDIQANALSNIFQRLYFKELSWEFNLLIIIGMALLGYLFQTDLGRRLMIKVPLDIEVLKTVVRIPVPLLAVTVLYFVIMYFVYTRTLYVISMTYHIGALYIFYLISGWVRSSRTHKLSLAEN